jgi:glutamyl-Q tRNA(Asp) synthetase
MASSQYIGRFAPSPTGPLHFGSLVAAVGSYIDARIQGGQWLLRIEDIDTPRCIPSATDDILKTLDAFGFEWDGSVVVQSFRIEAYREALEYLKQQGLVFACGCSRKEISDSGAGPAIDGGRVYPGTCRDGQIPLPKGRLPAWRLRVPNQTIHFVDRVFGAQEQNLAEAVGDFVLWRADGLVAYQLAVVVDDGWQGVTDVVRGADLLVSTTRQVWLQQCLGLPVPRYAHLPLVINAAGEKLSKQTRAPSLDRQHPEAQLVQALGFLGLSVPVDVAASGLSAVWAWAITNFPNRLPHFPMNPISGEGHQ